MESRNQNGLSTKRMTPAVRRPNRDREGPHGLPPPTPPDIRITYPAVRWIQLAMGTAMEARQSQAVEVAPRERDRQRRAAADAPRPMGGLDRVPGQVPAHAAATQLPVPPPLPLLPQRAAQSTPDPGVQLLEACRRFCKAKVGVPSIEVTPQIAHDAY